MENKIKVRFAPSPTGPFHIGGARSALFNWLVAKHTGGTFLVRIEDTDLARSSRESEENIKEAMKWLGLNWDEGIDVGGDNGPYRQTERLDIYKKEVQRLIDEGKAYYCYCTEEELQKEREEQLAEGKTPVYSGHCRHLTPEQVEEYKKEGRKPVVRLVVPTDKVYAFDDMVRGHVEFQSSGVGDFIIMKSDGIPVYNFAVVIDDALMGVTDVIRAEEHLSNTPRQLAIYEALGYKVPRFGHISLILGSDHKKMSKRHGATSVQAYRDMGYLPDAMVNYLALLGWAPKGEQELFTREELIKEFSMDRVSSNDAVFDIEKLNWINFQYMKKLTAPELLDFVTPFLEKAGYVTLPLSDEKRDWLEKVVWYVRDHLYFGQQVIENVKPFFEEPAPVEDAEIKAIIDAEDSHKILAAYAEALKALPEFNEDSIKKCFKAVMKETGIKGKAAFEPVRIALTGQTQGPGLYTMIELLGLEETEKRLNRF
ncbi:glutamate--tRNA ligase [Allisonella histaminiformans]|uniref:glutamate--tRNA ligase n=1 Tax=Allisonella histaminiformans TaxID=209880 RepID=UPI002E772ECF|nr:glutamate--tRNA ligase [Allisonella histaminiformans]